MMGKFFEIENPTNQGKLLDMICSFSWEKLVDMKENGVEFWTADGSKRLRIVEVNKKAKSIYMICCQTGKITWPLRFQKLEEVHNKIHSGEVGLNPHEIDKLIPTWGNYITGLLRFLGC
jgi:hypothetical protein